MPSFRPEDASPVPAVLRSLRPPSACKSDDLSISVRFPSDVGSSFAELAVTNRGEFTLEQAVRMITYDTATNWGFHDRGLLREGMAADIVVFDPETIGPRLPTVVYDLPAGAQRLKQTADGIAATVVNGEVVLRNNEHTGALPGQLLRGPLGRA